MIHLHYGNHSESNKAREPKMYGYYYWKYIITVFKNLCTIVDFIKRQTNLEKTNLIKVKTILWGDFFKGDNPPPKKF